MKMENQNRKRNEEEAKKQLSNLNEQFWNAVKEKNLAQIKHLLQFKPDLNWNNPNEKGKGTPLHIAAESGNIEILKLLLVSGASVDPSFSTSTNGTTPLHLAAKKGNAPAIELLLSAGSSVDQPENISRRYPLHYAANNNYLEVVKALVKSGANLSPPLPPNYCFGEYSPLFLAAENGNVEVVKYLITSGAKSSYPSKTRTTALHYACIFRDLELVKLLTCLGTDLRFQDYKGRIPFHYAFTGGSLEVVEYLTRCQNSSACTFDWFSARDDEGYGPLFVRNHEQTSRIV
eukprot:TRINITY_DN1984_c0_g1_i2.p1 TRINITY_DN1984_c0_g1~~TRINITY_DN1984_c0_g1_i2.p1  ORF type:complete len:289 (+),score=53.64 TRINITY_DN1984_c0_g1_i2:200-1066(+)